MTGTGAAGVMQHPRRFSAHLEWQQARGIPWDSPGVIPGHQAWRTSVSLRQQEFEPGASVLLPVPLLQEALVFIPEGNE